MPIYEFYCQTCHTVFSFFSARVDTEKRPNCPRCDRSELPRRPSRFATLKHRGEEAPDPLDNLDDSRLEGAMESLMREMDAGGNDEDPRIMGRMMRRFSELSGLEMGEKMEHFVEKLEAGLDPEMLEREMESAVGDEESLEDFFKLKKALGNRQKLPPAVDDELYYF